MRQTNCVTKAAATAPPTRKSTRSAALSPTQGISSTDANNQPTPGCRPAQKCETSSEQKPRLPPVIPTAIETEAAGQPHNVRFAPPQTVDWRLPDRCSSTTSH